MRLGVPTLSLLRGLLPLLFAVALVEFITARIVGRLSFHFAGNPIVITLYETGVLMIRATTLLVFASLILVSLYMFKLGGLRFRASSALLLLLIPTSLLAPYSAYILVLLLAVIFPLIAARTSLLRLPRAKGVVVVLLSATFIAATASVVFGSQPELRTLAELVVIATSVSLYFAFRRSGRLGLSAKIACIALPIMLLVAPKYLISVMPWTIRLVASFSLGFLLILPLEVYAAALALYLSVVFRVRSRIMKYGLLLLLLGGLPSWNVYPLLISALGFTLVIASFTETTGIE